MKTLWVLYNIQIDVTDIVGSFAYTLHMHTQHTHAIFFSMT